MILHWIFIIMSVAVLSYAVNMLLLSIVYEIRYRKQRRLDYERRNNQDNE